VFITYYAGWVFFEGQTDFLQVYKLLNCSTQEECRCGLQCGQREREKERARERERERERYHDLYNLCKNVICLPYYHLQNARWTHRDPMRTLSVFCDKERHLGKKRNWRFFVFRKVFNGAWIMHSATSFFFLFFPPPILDRPRWWKLRVNVVSTWVPYFWMLVFSTGIDASDLASFQ